MKLDQLDGETFVREKRYRKADIESIGMVLRAAWGLTDAQVDETLRAFFGEEVSYANQD